MLTCIRVQRSTLSTHVNERSPGSSAQDHRARLPRITGLLCSTGLDRRGQMAYDNPNLLIQPYSSPFVYKQFRYMLDWKSAGELFLSYTFECQFRSTDTGMIFVQHGTWEYCSHIQAIMPYFDFEGSTQEAKFKWTFSGALKGLTMRADKSKSYPMRTGCGIPRRQNS